MEVEQLLRECVTVVAARIYPQGDWQTGQYAIAEVTVQNESPYELRDVELRFGVPGDVVTAVKFVMFETDFTDTWNWSSIGAARSEKAYFWLQTVAGVWPFPVEVQIGLRANLKATVVVPLEDVVNDYVGGFDWITLV